MFYIKPRVAKVDYRGAAAPKNVRSVEVEVYKFH